MLDMFAAVKARYLGTALATSSNGIATQDEFPNIVRPYVIAVPIIDVLGKRTNVGDYHDVNFELHAIADTWEVATALGYQLQDAMLTPSLYFAGPTGRSVLAQKGRMTWRKEDMYWRCMVQFLCTIAKPPESRIY
jgi:hypothetical protein